VQPHTPAVPPPPHVTPVPLHGVPKPQSGIERAPPQLSVVLNRPQFLPASLHNTAFVFGVQPHTPVVPPPPHVTPVPLHVPHDVILRVPPQLSVVLYGPQFLPASLHNTPSVFGVHPHTPAVPPPPHVTPVPLHGVPNPQSGIERAPPQLSVVLNRPQFLPASLHNTAFVFGVHPHTPGVPPPPHVTPVPLHGVPNPQSAMLRVPPQLSVVLNGPQFLPASLHNTASVFGVQPHTPGVPPPPHVTPVPLQVPHDAMLRRVPQLSVVLNGSQFRPAVAQSCSFVFGPQPHTPGVPAPPHVTPVPLHGVPKPQSAIVRVPPQLSVVLYGPQFLPASPHNTASVFGVQPHTPVAPPPPHVTPVPVQGVPKPQSAMLRAPPQLSVVLNGPQFLPASLHNTASVFGVQPHQLGVPPPPQVTPVPLHVPHDAMLRALPQLSVVLNGPQFLLASAHSSASVFGVQPHTLLAPQTSGSVQFPHGTPVRCVPQLSGAETLPQFFPRRAQNCVLSSGVHVHTLLTHDSVPLQLPH